MEKKISDAGKAAAAFLGKAKNAVINAIDQNDDGKAGLDDVSIVLDSVKTAVKEKSEKISEKQEALRKERELKQLCPIFADDLDGADFSMTKLVRITEMDKRHADSELCKGSIGFLSEVKDLRVLHIYADKVDAFGLSFYPDRDSELYYVDPSDRDHYIALDDYFSYLKVARISELQKIAQDLGARHFRVIYKEQKKVFSSNSTKAAAKAKVIGSQTSGGDISLSKSTSDYSTVEIAAEMQFIGHKPVEPTLVYFKRDPQIQSLVSLRMSDNTITHQVYTLELSSSSGIKIKDAMVIDAALKSMKFEGNATVTSEAQNEARRVFEYEIDF